MWEHGGLPLREIGACRLVHARLKVLPFERRQQSSGALLIRVISLLGIHIDLDLLKDEATP